MRWLRRAALLEDGRPEEIAIYRPGQQAVQRFDMASLMTADRKVNYALEEGDIILCTEERYRERRL